MRVRFVGVGEAFDDDLPNNSQILEWHDCRMLIDCGYSVPQALWRMQLGPDYLDAIYVTHPHADHYFGLPSHLVRLAEDKRKREMLVLCPEGMKQLILDVIEYAYRGVLPRLGFEVIIHEVTTASPYSLRNAQLTFALSSHPVRNFSIAVSAEGKKYAYSGDGNFNLETRKLYRRCDMLVHECYSVDEVVRGHARAIDLVEMAKEENVQTLVLTHLQRDTRKQQRAEIERLISGAGVKAVIPEPGDIYEI